MEFIYNLIMEKKLDIIIIILLFTGAWKYRKKLLKYSAKSAYNSPPGYKDPMRDSHSADNISVKGTSYMLIGIIVVLIIAVFLKIFIF